MKVYYIVALAKCLLITSCKKETAATDNKPVETNNTNNFSSQICSVEDWASSGDLESNWPTVNLVYNNKAYLPTNFTFTNQKVWIYDGNTWVDIPSNVPVYTNYKNFEFTLGNKGYLACMVGAGAFYEYDFASNVWTCKADFPGVAEQGMATFTIGNKGYVAAGADFSFDPVGQTWEYNPATDQWTKKASLPLGRVQSTGFALNNKGYVVNGWTGFGDLNSLIEYDPGANSWTFKTSFPGTARSNTQAFVIDGIAYAGGGENGSSNVLKDFYKYDASTNTWTGILDIPLPSSANEYSRNCFAINSRGYVGWVGDNGPKLKKYTPRICVDFPTPAAR